MTILEYAQHERKRNKVTYSSKGLVAVLAALVSSAYSVDTVTGKGDPVVITDEIRKFFSEQNQQFYVSVITQNTPETCIYTWVYSAFVANSNLLFNTKDNSKLSSAFINLRQELKRCLIANMPLDDSAPNSLIKIRKLLCDQLGNGYLSGYSSNHSGAEKLEQCG